MARPDRITDLRSNGHKATEDKWELALADRGTRNLTWADAGAEDLLAAVVAATEDGAALLLSKTSDGGALVIHVLTGASRHKLYPSDAAQLNEALSLISRIS